MRHQFIIDCESPDRVFLRDVTITRCRINDVDEPVTTLAMLKGYGK